MARQDPSSPPGDFVFDRSTTDDGLLLIAPSNVAVDRYIADHGYGDQVATLVAFSGSVTDEAGVTYTESGMNGFPDTQTAERFADEDVDVLVAAEKFQTGFDQPLLYAMYVDKTLVGLAAVQTLSRLNRIHPAKDGTFVLDFRNDEARIRDAFQPYFDRAVAMPTDPNLLYDLRAKLDHYDVLRDEEVRRVAELIATTPGRGFHGAVFAGLDPAYERFMALDEDAEDAFRDTLNSFVRAYGFLSQLVPFERIVARRWPSAAA